MAQGDIQTWAAAEALKAVGEMFDAIPKSKRTGFIGHLNDISFFIEAATRAAPKAKPGK
jgi:hypothetical protein